MEVGDRARIIKDTYPLPALNTGGVGTVVGYAENLRGKRLYALNVDGVGVTGIELEGAKAGSLNGWAYLDTELEAI